VPSRGSATLTLCFGPGRGKIGLRTGPEEVLLTSPMPLWSQKRHGRSEWAKTCTLDDDDDDENDDGTPFIDVELKTRFERVEYVPFLNLKRVEEIMVSVGERFKEAETILSMPESKKRLHLVPKVDDEKIILMDENGKEKFQLVFQKSDDTWRLVSMNRESTRVLDCFGKGDVFQVQGRCVTDRTSPTSLGSEVGHPVSSCLHCFMQNILLFVSK
jgi:hypothetical protein